MARLGGVGQGTVWFGTAWFGSAGVVWFGGARHGAVWLGVVRRGMFRLGVVRQARFGTAWRGKAWRGRAWQGMAGQGSAGMVGQGKAGRGLARHGAARQILSSNPATRRRVAGLNDKGGNRMNKVYLTGNLTRDPEVRNTQSGKAYARFGIAVNRPFSKDKDAVDFFNLTAWDKTAEFIGKYFNKGSRAVIEGRLQTGKYKDKQGNEVTTVEVVVDNVEFGGGKKNDDDKEFPNSTPIDDDDLPFR